MKKKQVTPAQVDYLFQFMRRKYVRYYDVQIELVDHFASAIEAKWEKDPTLSFEKAIEEVYAGFPVTGFNNLMQEKTQAIVQRITKQTWKEVKAYLTIPKISLTLLLVAICNCIYSYIPYPTFVASILIWLICLSSLYAVQYQIRPQRNKKTKFLTLNAITTSQAGFSGIVGCMPYYVGPETISSVSSLLLSTLTIIAILVGYGHFKVASKVFEEWKRQFPQFV